MKTKSTLAVAIAALMSVGMVGQALAYTSAGSVIEYTDFSIKVFENGGQVLAPEAIVSNFNFVTTNTTTLNGTTIADSDTCAGVNDGMGGFTNNCGAGPVLDTPLQLLGTSTHTENDYTLDGPGAGGTYSYSDSVINTSELVPVPGANPTAASLIAETEMTNTGSGNSTATIQSTTGFTFNFTLATSGSLTIEFMADPDMYAASADGGAPLALAESSIAFVALLTQNTGGTGSATWSPDGILAGCSDLAGGVTCSGEVDPNTLNNKVAITTDNTSDFYNPANGMFFISIDNLTSGNWSFTLTSTVANSVNKIAPEAVPEPSTILLLGAGIAGLGAFRRFRKA